MPIYKKLLLLLSPYELKKLIILVIMMMVMALLDVVGVASILPFVAVLTNPSIIDTNILLTNLQYFLSNLGIETQEEFLFAFGVIVFLLLIFSLSFRAFTTYLTYRFVFMLEHSIGKRLVKRYLYQNYEWLISQHSSDLGKNILSEVTQVIGNGIRPFMELISNCILVVSIVILLILVDSKISFIVILTLGGSYLIIFYFVKKFLQSKGEERFNNNKIRFTSVTEAFNALKEVKFGAFEETYIERFSNSSKIYASTAASTESIAHLPRFILEAICFGGILLTMLYMMRLTGNFNNSLPIISLYIFAGYRLMPSLQQIYRCVAKLTFIGPSIEKLFFDLNNLIIPVKNQIDETLTLEKEIKLHNINYYYPETFKFVLKDTNFIIPARTSVGLIGTTGSGKTTTVDIILGLLWPKKGTLTIDGKIITKNNLRAWQKLIGYVPQKIYLSDDTVMANIALGEKPENVDMSMVIKAAKIANIHKLVVDQLPKKYETNIGENGVRLSGGQRQRIGIARALYHNPKVLILDEATSSLDNQTEEEIMNSINLIKKDATIIIIAHRLNSLKHCDFIFKCINGKFEKQ
jgi:ABC-type multidrug transport system fused ATPase/permease subunit